MVARNRFNVPKPVGAETAQKRNAGFSRIPADFLSSNRHAGLYAYKVRLHRLCNIEDLQEMGKHFAKERRMRNAERRKVNRVRSQKLKRNLQENFVSARSQTSHFCRGCEKNLHTHKQSSCETLNRVPPKVAFVPRGLKRNGRATQGINRVPNKSNEKVDKRIEELRKLSWERMASPRKSNGKSENGVETNFDAADLSI